MQSRPHADSDAMMARLSIGPLLRPSRPTMIGPAGNFPANAATNRAATSGVSVSPTIPRSPLTLMINSLIFIRLFVLGVKTNQPASLRSCVQNK